MSKTEKIKQQLIEEYGYKTKDFIAEDGKEYHWKTLESMLKNEIEADGKNEIEEEVVNTDFDLSDFDEIAIDGMQSKFNDNDLIMVMSGVSGSLTHYSQTGNGVYRFKNFGQKQKMPYKELRDIANLNPKILEEGWIIILNKDAIEELRLAEVYRYILTPKRLATILYEPVGKLQVILENLPKTMQLTLLNKAKEDYVSGKLESIKTIKLLEKHFNMSFEDNLPL